MFDLLLTISVQPSQFDIIAQAQAAIVYLPVSTTQSSRPNCVTYTATNTTGKTVREVSINRRNRQGKIFKYPLRTLLRNGVLKKGEKVAFDLCDNTFVNVEAKQ
jgi:Tfp pilus assembly protein PilP